MSLSKEPQDAALEAAQRIAALVVATFLGDQARIGIDDREDLVATLVEHWWLKGKAFKEDGSASRDTYMRTVFRNKLRDLTEVVRAAKRGSGGLPLSMESPANPQDPEGETSLAETIVDKGFEADVEAVAANNELRGELAGLRPYLAKNDWELLAALWQDPRVRPASALIGVHHSTANARLRRILAVAEERGLRQYL